MPSSSVPDLLSEQLPNAGATQSSTEYKLQNWKSSRTSGSIGKYNDQQSKALTFQMGTTREGEGNNERLGLLSGLSGHPHPSPAPYVCQTPEKKQSPGLSKPPSIRTTGWDRQPEPKHGGKGRKESCGLRLSTPSQNTGTRSDRNFGMFAIHMSTPEHKVHLVHIRLLHTLKQAIPFRMLLAVWGILPIALDTHQVSGFEAFWIWGIKESLT